MSSLVIPDVLAVVLAARRGLIRPEELANSLAGGCPLSERLGGAWAGLTAEAALLTAAAERTAGLDSPPTVAPSLKSSVANPAPTRPAEGDEGMATVAPTEQDTAGARRADRLSRLTR